MGGNLVENWDTSYRHLEVTYTERPKTPGELVNLVQFEFVYADIFKYLSGLKSPRVLEVGCGGARTSVYLARRGCEMVCSDTSPEALQLAQRNFAAAGANGVVVQDDLMHSKLTGEPFDCVMSFGLLEHFPDLDVLVKPLTQLVKPGGIQIHCIIPKKFSTQVLADAAYFPFRFMKNAVKGRWSRIVSRSYRDFPHFENSFSATEYCAAFKRAGHDILRCEAAGMLLPLFALPMGVGDALTSIAGPALIAATRRVDRTESRLLHWLSPTFYIVARRTEPNSQP